MGNGEMRGLRARSWRAFIFPCLASPAVLGCGVSESDAGAVEDRSPSTIVTRSGVEMVMVPGGWFQMGDDEGNEDEGPVHRVWVDAFLMDKYEVTQDQYRQLQLSDPSRFQGDRLPVEQRAPSTVPPNTIASANINTANFFMSASFQIVGCSPSVVS